MNDLIKRNCDFSNQLELHPDNPYIQKYGISKEYIGKSIKGDRFLLGGVKKLIEAHNNDDKKEALDKAMDCAVTALNVVYKMMRAEGLSHDDATQYTQAAFEFKVKNNMSKVENGKPLFDLEGNIVKPNSFRKLDYSPFFRNG